MILRNLMNPVFNVFSIVFNKLVKHILVLNQKSLVQVFLNVVIEYVIVDSQVLDLVALPYFAYKALELWQLVETQIESGQVWTALHAVKMVYAAVAGTYLLQERTVV